SQKLIFIGYNEETLGYRLMDLKTKKVYTSKDVEFFLKKEVENPPPNSPDVYYSPVVKKEATIPTNDESDDGND
ncbi:hypothetical protein KI387_017258, partial [Taxus chinensis]